jgi:hypothetical protein
VHQRRRRREAVQRRVEGRASVGAGARIGHHRRRLRENGGVKQGAQERREAKRCGAKAAGQAAEATPEGAACAEGSRHEAEASTDADAALQAQEPSQRQTQVRDSSSTASRGRSSRRHAQASSNAGKRLRRAAGPIGSERGVCACEEQAQDGGAGVPRMRRGSERRDRCERAALAAAACCSVPFVLHGARAGRRWAWPGAATPAKLQPAASARRRRRRRSVISPPAQVQLSHGGALGEMLRLPARLAGARCEAEGGSRAETLPPHRTPAAARPSLPSLGCLSDGSEPAAHALHREART